MKESPSDILVIQLTKMGDLLQTTPLLYRIRKRYPNAAITVLIDSHHLELTSAIPFIDRVIPLDLTSIKNRMNQSDLTLFTKYNELRAMLAPVVGEHFDLIYNINFSKITALLCHLFPTAEIVGYRLEPHTQRLLRERWVSFIFHLMRNRNLVRFNLVDLLANYGDDDSPPSRNLFYGRDNEKMSGQESSLPGKDDEIVKSQNNVTPVKTGVQNPLKSLDSGACPGLRSGIRWNDGKRTKQIFYETIKDGCWVIGLQMGCGGYLRRWPLRSFASLAYTLVKQDQAQVILFGGKGEESLGRQFLEEWRRLAGYQPPAGSVIDLIGKTTLSQLAAALKSCDLLISGDTGTMHLAAAVGTPVLALFMGTALCHETGPYGEGHLVLQAHMDCSPCSEGENSCRTPRCQQLIEPEMVYQVVSSKMRNPSPPLFSKEGNSVPSPFDKGRQGGILGGSPLHNEMKGSHSRGYVQIYRAVMDEWGVKFLPLLPRELDIGEMMAGVYREVGRKMMYPSYPIYPENLFYEFSSFYRGMTLDTQEKVAQIIKTLATVQSICEMGARESSSLTSSEIVEKIRKTCGSLDVLTPLDGFFKDLKTGNETVLYPEDFKTKNACEAMLFPIKSMLDLLRPISSLPINPHSV
jgi:ADP-heptose:LPS heptosyltransferase